MINYEIYHRRQAIVEHPYGVIKRQWNFYYIMAKKTIKHASADVGLIFTAYNLKKIFNLINQNELKQYLKVLALFLESIKGDFKDFCHYIKFEINLCLFYKQHYYCTTNQLYLLKIKSFWKL